MMTGSGRPQREVKSTGCTTGPNRGDMIFAVIVRVARVGADACWLPGLAAGRGICYYFWSLYWFLGRGYVGLSRPVRPLAVGRNKVAVEIPRIEENCNASAT